MQIQNVDPPVRLHPLSFLVDGDEVVVGRIDIDSYGVFPADGAALIECLTADGDLAAAARWYLKAYGEPIDMADFVHTLYELDFVDDGSGSRPAPGAGPAPLLQRVGRAAFGPVAWVGYATLAVTAVVAMVADPGLRPHLDHVFFSEYLLVIELTLAFGQIPLILLHEVFHLLAARRLGVRARIRLGQRLYFVVFETVMDGLVMVPRSKRYLPILAGMMADLLVVCLLTVVAWLTMRPDGAVSVVGAVCLGLAFITLVRFATEFLLFLRTDVYYLVSTVYGCVDLHGSAREMAHNWWWRRLGRPGRQRDRSRWHPQDVAVARWYAPLYVAGYALAIGMLVVVIIPIMWRFFGALLAGLLTGDLRSAHFWDAAGLLLLNLAEPLLAGVLKLRDRVQDGRRRRHTSRRHTSRRQAEKR